MHPSGDEASTVAATPGDVAVALAAWRDLALAREIGREGTRRAARLAHDAATDAGLGASFRRPPPRLHYPRFGWREAVRHAVDNRMLTREHVVAAARWAALRARAAATAADLDLEGMVFTGRDVHLRPRPDHGRLVVGPWCWIGDGCRLRVHGGTMRLGAKVVLGSGNQINGHLDVLVGDQVLMADNGYVCDFDHRFARLDLPIRQQGIAMTPVRIGDDCWLGDQVTVLRGSDVGRGTVVGAQSVVRGHLDPFSIAVGAPARAVRSRLAAGMDPEEAATLAGCGLPIPGDPLED